LRYKPLIKALMDILEDCVVGICQEAIELGFIGHIAEGKTAQFQKRRVCFDVFDELRDRFDLLEMFYDESPQDGMLRVAGSADTVISVWQDGKIDGLKEIVIFLQQR
jgi:hypothetical protein